MKLPPFLRRSADAAPRPAAGAKTAWAVAGCALAVALTMLAPLALFAAGDAARFSRGEEMTAPYQPRTVAGDDLYLVRMLAERSDAEVASYQTSMDGAGELDDSQPIYLSGSDNLQYSPVLAPRCKEVLSELVDAGVLRYDWVSTLLDEPDDVTQSWFYGASDTLGFLTISRREEGGEGQEQMRMTLESRTGKVVALQLDLNTAYATQPDAESVLRAWVAFNDLDILGDWQPPAGTRWQDTGLYSARGGLLATCVSVNLAEGHMAISLDLVPCTPEQLQAAALAGQGEASGITDAQIDAAQTLYRLDSRICNQGEVVYYLRDAGGHSLVMCLDTIHGLAWPACRVSGCPHAGPECPACIEREVAALHRADDGGVYLFLPESYERDGQRLPPQILEIAADWQSRRTVAELTGDHAGFLAVGQGVAYVALNSEESDYGTQPRRVAAIDLATGQRTLTPTLLDNNEQLQGCCGNCLMVMRSVSGRADRNPGSGYSDLSSQIDQRVATMEAELIDPATGARRHIAWLPGSLSGGGQPYNGMVDGSEWLFTTYTLNTADELETWNVVVDLRSGEPRALQLPSNLFVTNAALAPEGGFAGGWLYITQPGIYGSVLLYAPDAGEQYEIPDNIPHNGWNPQALTAGGLLMAHGDIMAGGACLIAQEELVRYGQDALRPVEERIWADSYQEMEAWVPDLAG